MQAGAYQVPTRIYKPDPVDGEKIWMVATECIMTLFALLYAFPHIPGALLEDVFAEDGEQEDEAWFSVKSTSAMRAAMESILKTSEVLSYSVPTGKVLDTLTKDIVSKDVLHHFQKDPCSWLMWRRPAPLPLRGSAAAL